MDKPTLLCPCGQAFTPSRRTHRFCSERCRARFTLAKERPCLHCGQPFRPSKMNKGVKCCSHGCASSHLAAVAAAKRELLPPPASPLMWAECVCGGWYIRRAHRSCCRSCTGYQPAPLRQIRCGNCGWLFWQERTGGKLRQFCSPSCTTSFAQRRARARAAGVMMAPYTREQIYRRDEYVCQLCGELVDVSLPPQHAGAATIDHIVPISHGGPDTPANVQLAHRACNSKKGNRVDPITGQPLADIGVAGK